MQLILSDVTNLFPIQTLTCRPHVIVEHMTIQFVNQICLISSVGLYLKLFLNQCLIRVTTDYVLLYDT